MWGGDRSVADMLPYDSAVLAFYQGIIGGPISPRLGELDPQFFQHCATIRLINSEPLSQWKPSKRNGNGWSIAIGTGIRCLSEMVSTQPTTCHCVTVSTALMWNNPASPSWLPWCTVSTRRLPRLRMLRAHTLATVDCRVAQAINVGNRDAGQSHRLLFPEHFMLPLHHSPNRRTGQVFMRGVHTGQQGDVCRRVPSRKDRPDKLVCAGHAWSSSSVRSIASTALGSVRSSLLENGARSLFGLG